MTQVQTDRPLFEARGLALRYGRQQVLSGVDLRIRRTEFWFFLGPNGAGKTTLLRALLGLMRPAAGQLRIDALASRRNIGFVPQRCNLNPTLPTTVREFVLLGLVGTDAPAVQRDERLREALGHVGLAEMAGRQYGELSGGQRQRALVARALVRRPRVLLLDEPTNGLDLTAEDALMRGVFELNRREGLTVIFVTHDLALATRYGTHFALFHGGGVAAGGAPEMLTPDHLRQTWGVEIEAHQRAGAAVVQLPAAAALRNPEENRPGEAR